MLSFRRDPSYREPQLGNLPSSLTYPIEGGEVGRGGQYIKQLPVTDAGPIAHKAAATTAGDICGKGSR